MLPEVATMSCTSVQGAGGRKKSGHHLGNSIASVYATLTSLCLGGPGGPACLMVPVNGLGGRAG